MFVDELLALLRLCMSTPRLLALLAASCALALFPAACSKDPSQDTPVASEKRPIRAYETRGRVVAIPQAPKPDAKDAAAKPPPPTQRLYSIRHERIEKFEDSKGRVSPMRAMVMKFSPAEGVDMTTLKVGDPITFTFEVHWENDPEHILKVTKFNVMPGDTVLEFDKPKMPPTDAKPSEPAAAPTTKPAEPQTDHHDDTPVEIKPEPKPDATPATPKPSHGRE